MNQMQQMMRQAQKMQAQILKVQEEMAEHREEATAGGGVVTVGASGKGEFLIRLVERYGVRGIGIDISPYEVPVARERAAARVPEADLQFIEADAATQSTASDSVELAICGWSPSVA